MIQPIGRSTMIDSSAKLTKLFAKGYPLRGDAAIVVVRRKKPSMAATRPARPGWTK
jgi:hypothetical protein